MQLGKILLGAVIGVGAIAAAPFTGGGSVLGAATLATSLAGAGALAAGAGAAGAGAGYLVGKKEEEEDELKDREIAKFKQKASKYEDIVNEHKEHTQTIIAMTALGVSIANIDGHFSDEELDSLHEFAGGIASAKYPQYIVDKINKLIETPPTFNEAMRYLKKVDAKFYGGVRNLLVAIAEADGDVHPEEKAFLKAFDKHLSKNDYENVNAKFSGETSNLLITIIEADEITAFEKAFLKANDNRKKA